MTQNIEKKENKKSKHILFFASKIMVVITIIVGIVGILTTPDYTNNYFAEENVLFSILEWTLSFIISLQMIFLSIGFLEYAIAWKNNNSVNKKEAKGIMFFMLISIVIIIIAYSFMNSIHVYI
ncbi:MAG: hypothetical protein KAS78_05825 [Candidatus Pacebacteria bacterium]|nr:hypothetical protein [Candidatus Paceibacterota bacterium]